MNHRAHHAWGDEVGWRATPDGLVPCDVNEATVVVVQPGRRPDGVTFEFTENEQVERRKLLAAFDLVFEIGGLAALRHVRETLGIREGR